MPLRVLSLGLALALGACTLVNAPSDRPAPRPDEAEPARPEAVSRQFGGQFSVQGTTLPVVLSLVVRGEEVEEARLSVPELGMEAEGDGRLRNGRLELHLRYGGDGCEGEARITGDLEADGYRFQGILGAEDCTGSEEGALVLRLRPEGGAAARTRPFLVESSPPGA